MKISGFLYPKGSEWRKFDLHIHTPASYDWDKNCTASMRDIIDEAIKEKLSVIAITDHHSIKNIDDAMKEAIEKNLMVLPGVELRTDKGNKGVHIIGLFNSSISSKTIYDKLLCPLNLSEDDVKKKGNEQIYCNFEEACQKIHELGGLVLLHAGNKSSSIEQLDSDVRAVLKKDLAFLVDIFEVSSEKQADDYRKIVFPKIKQTFPCIVTSDACDRSKLEYKEGHSIGVIGKHFTWIKADPTFEGLKQIIYEPEERVYIGEEPPSKIERDKIIKSVTISNSNQWLEDDKPIFLSEDLVSIIGGKGTGKTALLDLIAYTARSYKCYEKEEIKSKSFLRKAYKELKGMKIKMEWAEGSEEQIIIGDKLEEATKEGKVKYLPQDFIDHLCSEIGKSELEKQIENVIFQRIPAEDKANFTDFKSFKEAQLNVINDKKDRLKKKIEEKNSEIYKHREMIKSKDFKNEEIRKAESEIKKYEQELKEISDSLEASDEQKIIIEKLSSLNDKKSSMEKAISDLSIKIKKIEEIKNEADKFLEDSRAFILQLETDLEEIGLAEEESVKNINIVLYPENIKEILDDYEKKINDCSEKYRGELNRINEEIKNLNSKITLEKSKRDKIREINKSLSELKQRKDSLNGEIEEIKKAEEALEKLLEGRKGLFLNYFELIFEEKRILKQIYQPLESVLKGSAEENEKLFDFTVKFNFDIETMAREGDSLIDHSNKGRFVRSSWESLKIELEGLKLDIDLNNEQLSLEDKRFIVAFPEKIRKLFLQDPQEQSYSITSQLKKEYTELDFDNWLYSTKYYDISYSIKFSDVELQNLSPGIKGVALLILFLELDKEDKRPILIDQPEENLDNRSVYITLMRYFREAKKRRQVVIVTHNPNLVVNADSEQIIVANFDRGLEKQASRIRYVSGSLENTFKIGSKESVLERQGIREHVCEILEGGEEAFKKRENKYQIK